MNPNILSRLVRSTGSPSIYETIRQDDDASDDSDVEERAGMTLGDENSRTPLQGPRPDDADHRVTTQSAAFLGQQPPGPSSGSRPVKKKPRGSHASRPQWLRTSPQALEAEEGDDDVPASLLVEGADVHEDSKPPPPPPQHHRSRSGASARWKSPDASRRRWEAARAQQPLHPPTPPPGPPRPRGDGGIPGLASASPRDKAMWRWTNVENLDNFLKDVYIYFIGNGIWSIMLHRILNLLTLAFVVGFSTFLTNCINYREVRNSRKLEEILIPKCMARMSTSSTLLLWLFTFFWIGKLMQYILDIPRLRHMHDFYLYLLNIPDSEIQTISWQEVVSRLMTLRDANPATAAPMSAKHRRFLGSQSKQRMDAHDIANRLMRKENYLIALFNKDILDLTLPLPFLRNRQLFSRTLEWNLNLCVMDYVFNEQGQVRPIFLRETHRRALSEGLRRRFIFAGVMNIFTAPFIVVYFMMHYFFRYFTEYQKNPSQIGSRQYTPLAEWKFREFNELWHLFERRMNMSYPFASRYVEQFPQDKTAQFSRFVAFIAGALASVLALASLLDPELFLGFEITHDRTVLFYLGMLGSIWAIARGLCPEETDVFDPEFALMEVIKYTHYCPAHWTGRMHTDEVRQEFTMLYQRKIVIFLEEILSMIFTPFVLWFSLPRCSDRIIDFFREFTVHVDGLGYVCSFAVFNFQKGTNVISQGGPGQPGRDLRDDYYSTKDGKMLASYYGFLDSYGTDPRTGAPRRRFHPPPAFPGLGTMEAPRDATNLRQFPQSPVAAPMGRPPTQRGPTTAPSPLPSMLLDPHHQPSASGFRTVAQDRGQGRFRTTRQPSDTLADVAESEDTSQVQAQADRRGEDSTGAVATSDGNLEGSWRMNLAGETDDSDGGDEDNDVEAVVKKAGVLGLIHQFQKAGTEARAGGKAPVDL